MSAPHTHGGLIAKLEAAEAGSRLLDAQVWCAVHGIGFKKPLVVKGQGDRFWSFRTDKGDIGLHGDDKRGRVEPYTTSLDAALALTERVLPGWMRNMDERNDGRWSVGVFDRASLAHYQGLAANPALSTCIAILRAKEAQS